MNIIYMFDPVICLYYMFFIYFVYHNYTKHEITKLADIITIEDDTNDEEKKEEKKEPIKEIKYVDKYLEKFYKLTNEELTEERLISLKNCILFETTPQGNVSMFYNNERKSFIYYSDNTIPYRYLEVVGRKYVITYNCKIIYWDMEKELQKIKDEKERKEEEKKEEKKEEDKKKEEKKEEDAKIEIKEEKKSVFAKLKNYNKETTVKASNKPTAAPVNAQIVKENANRYSYEGKMANYSFLKKPEKKTGLSFADFKKMKK
jgi:hypothetical protein